MIRRTNVSRGHSHTGIMCNPSWQVDGESSKQLSLHLQNPSVGRLASGLVGGHGQTRRARYERSRHRSVSEHVQFVDVEYKIVG